MVYWAEERGLILDRAAFQSQVADLEDLEGGLEHQVFGYQEIGRVVKVTKPPNFGLYEDLPVYVRNLIRCNLVFGDDVRLVGVLETDEGAALVTSQDFVPGKSPSEEQVDRWFLSQGCQKLSKYVWRYPDGTRVADTHARNFILTPNHQVVPIDLHVEVLGEAWQSEFQRVLASALNEGSP